MMTFKQFLTEQDDQIEAYARRIVNDCQPVIKQSGGNPMQYTMYRGMDRKLGGFDQQIAVRQIRSDRLPKDSYTVIHHAMDDWFKRNFGVAFRSNSIAVTPSQLTAGRYGTECLVFPIGQFSYVWSPDMKDIGMEIETQVKQIVRDEYDDPPVIGKLDQREAQQYVDRVMNQARFYNDGLEKALNVDGNEIMVSGSQYYAINVDEDEDYAVDQEQFKQALQQQYQGM